MSQCDGTVRGVTDPGGGDLFIVDNSISGWTALEYLRQWTDVARSFDIATGFFEIGALLALYGKWQQLDKVRILMGDEVSLRTREAFAEALEQRQRRLERYRERRRRTVQAGVSFTEFADLSDGRRVIMRNDRGFSRRRHVVIQNNRGLGSSRRDSPDPWDGVTRQSLAAEVREYLLAEEEDCCPISPESVIEHLQRCYDLEVDAASVQAALQLPRRIEFGSRLLNELSRHE